MPSSERTSEPSTAMRRLRRMRARPRAIASSSRDEMETLAPSAASAFATAKPSPLLAPATSATLPSVRDPYTRFSTCKPASTASHRPMSCVEAAVDLYPVQHAIQRLARRLVERGRGRAGRRARQRAAAMQYFLANRHPDPFLKLEPHQRNSAVEHVRRIVDAAGAKQRHDPTRISGKAKPVIAPSRPPSALRAETRPRARRRSAPGCHRHAARMRDVLNGVGGSSSLIVRALGISVRSAPAATAPSRIRRLADSPGRRSRCRPPRASAR